MPRSLWSGSLSFGLVNVPVALYTAVRDVDLHFHQLHAADAARIDIRRYCSREEREIDYEEVGRAHEASGGRPVVLTDEELEAVAPRRTRTIDIEAFVDLAQVDPIHFDHPYFLLPDGDTEGTRRAYRLLVDVMAGAGRAALGRFVMRLKEHLVLIRVRDDRLALTTMRFADEIRPAEGIETDGARTGREEVDRAVALVEALSVDWDPADYRDSFRERLLQVIERKRQGETIRAPREEKPPEPVPDLMAALERSLRTARSGRDGRRRRDEREPAGTRRRS